MFQTANPEVTKSKILSLLDSYRESNPTQRAVVDHALSLIGSESTTASTSAPLTASAYVLSPDYQSIVLVYHRKHEMWVPPGGHVEQDELSNPLLAAIRETKEECGLANLMPLSHALFDLRVLPYQSIGTGTTTYYCDLFFVFVADNENLNCSPESVDCKWVRLPDLCCHDMRNEYQNLGLRLAQFVKRTTETDISAIASAPRTFQLDQEFLSKFYSFHTGNPHRDLWRLGESEIGQLLVLAGRAPALTDHLLWKSSIDEDLSREEFLDAAQEEALDQLQRLLSDNKIPDQFIPNLIKISDRLSRIDQCPNECIRSAASDLRKALCQWSGTGLVKEPTQQSIEQAFIADSAVADILASRQGDLRSWKELTRHQTRTNWVAITGSIGAGKTTLLAELENRGFKTIPEVARGAILHAQNIGFETTEIFHPSNSRARQDGIFGQTLEALMRLDPNEKLFLDRSVVDVLAFCIAAQIEPERYVGLERLFHFAQVLHLAPHQNYSNDKQRPQSHTEAQMLDQIILNTYRSAGYSPVIVPATDPDLTLEQQVQERADRVLELLQSF